MIGEANPAIAPKDMSERLYGKFSQLIYSECGIKLPPIKKIMLQSRLLKRMKILGIPSFEEYYNCLTGSQGRKEELAHALDVVSTNKTDFFREPFHFDYLRAEALPRIIESLWNKPRRKIHLWSAGCSSGEEPYTLAMVLSDFLRKYTLGAAPATGAPCCGRPQEYDYDIFSTDLSLRVLAKAQQAIYSDSDIRPVPHHLKAEYLMKGKGDQTGNWRVVPELRNRIQFSRLNLMEAQFKLPTMMDIIFCRNVIIYFDRPTQACLFQKFYNCLVSGGYLFIGHSETLYGINDQFQYLQATIYKKP